MAEQPGIVITGGSGRMGQMLIRTVLDSDTCRLVGVLEREGHDWIGRDIGEAMGGAPAGVTVTDDALAGRLGVAIQGKGAFLRFKATLAPNEKWSGAWLTFSNERQLGRARWWLADEGLRPATSANA